MLPVLALLFACNHQPESLPKADGADDQRVVLDAEAVGPDPAAVQAYQEALLEHADLKGKVGSARSGILDFQVEWVEDSDGNVLPSTEFRAVVYDYETNEAFAVEGDLEEPDGPLDVALTDERPRPTPWEFQLAIDLALDSDPDLAGRYADGQIEFFRAMPGLGYNDEGDRIVHIGLRPTLDDEAPDAQREIVGANLSSGDVIHYSGGAPITSSIDGFICNPPPSAFQASPWNQVGWARVTLRKGGEELWRFIVQRPSTSNGSDGSGLEVADVRFRGKRMLYQAHIPILNVKYRNDTCGPYRDWQDQENKFQIGNTLVDLANGVKLVDWAKTIRDLDDDTGNFEGVALYWDEANQQAVAVSELEAGWYRYLTEWRFGLDGEVVAKFGFDAVQNYCTCRVHTHHAYLRFDVDLGDGNNSVSSYDELAGWQEVTTEGQFLRSDDLDRKWRVTDPATGDSVLLIPGKGEDHADSYGIADLWALRSHPDEIDDRGVQPYHITQAGLPKFVTGESTVDTDLVLWGAGHFLHDDSDPLANQTHTITWTLVPENW